MPVRIQRQRTAGWRKPDGAIYVGRGSAWGNPLRIGMWKGYTAANAVRDYRAWVDREPTVRSFEHTFGIPPTCEEIKELRGKDLMCWCKLGDACHADVLLELANAD
jgi:hypothetical protein